MGDTSYPSPGCLPSGTAHLNGNQTTQSNATGNSTAVNEGLQDTVTTSSKAFDGSLYYRQSNMMLNGKQRRGNGFDEPQHNGHREFSNPLVTSSSSHVQVKVPPAAVSSELSTNKPVIPGRSANGVAQSRENVSYMERLKKSFPSTGNHTTSSSQEALANKFMQRSRESLHKKEKQKNNTGSKKEHSPKSVSFANSVLPSKDEKDYLKHSGPRDGSTWNGSVTSREHTIQSNVVLSGKLGQSLIGPGSHSSEMKRIFDQTPRQQIASAERESLLKKEDNKYGDTGDVPLPPSPPTRDISRIPDCYDSQQSSGSVQVLSLYDEHSLFSSNFPKNSAALPRQSNVNLEFDGSRTLRSSVAPSGRSQRDQFLQQSNSKVDLTASHSLRSSGRSRDYSLTVEELLLSSGSMNSSPENSPPTKFTQSLFDRNSYCSKREHSLDDYVDEKGNLLQDLRYGIVELNCYVIVM